MFRTFNMGIGMVAVVDKRHADRALRHLASVGQKAWVLGEIAKGPQGVLLE
jgi:phosphoribosylformylglycinamidine cyclo-ligase